MRQTYQPQRGQRGRDPRSLQGFPDFVSRFEFQPQSDCLGNGREGLSSSEPSHHGYSNFNKIDGTSAISRYISSEKDRLPYSAVTFNRMMSSQEQSTFSQTPHRQRQDMILDGFDRQVLRPHPSQQPVDRSQTRVSLPPRALIPSRSRYSETTSGLRPHDQQNRGEELQSSTSSNTRLRKPRSNPKSASGSSTHYAQAHPSRLRRFSPKTTSSSVYSQQLSQRSCSPSFLSSPSNRVEKRHMFHETRQRHGRIETRTPERPVRLPVQSPENQMMQDVPPSTSRLARNYAPPVVNGIQLVAPQELSDRLRSVFPYELFNAIQSKCFDTLFRTEDNAVVCAPTGSGKTCLFELAICKAVESMDAGQFKIVYSAPTKSLCAERTRDWRKKFEMLNLECAELTGDTGPSEMRKVGSATIIVTTPEKWDSITRKWKDHLKLLQMVKLFLIDEVHILNDARGATLEVIVSRMKSIGANVRFVALSATIPNADDVSHWLGRDPSNTHMPAICETFGEEFRPVKLSKHVQSYDPKGSNDFAFENTLNSKLPLIIQKHSLTKPIMIFCCTRGSCETTAGKLSDWWQKSNDRDRAWQSPTVRIVVGRKDLQSLVANGVAFHHGGLDTQDRAVIESGYLNGQISVICCTSTLAVGVNLPCHLVIIKNTVCYGDHGLREYSDLEIMQMLGRAGRPQFDDTADAVILTRHEKADRYRKMLCGQETLESTLHQSLIEHLNSEIGLGTVKNVETAKRWLTGTFLSVRMRKNPQYYRFDGIDIAKRADDKLERVCERNIKLLQDAGLVTKSMEFSCTEYGQIMSRYMISFDTMRLLLSIPDSAKISQILLDSSQAIEFKDFRIKPNERAWLRDISKSAQIKYPIIETISSTAHKISLIVQAQLGGIDPPNEQPFARRQFIAEKGAIFERLNRLIHAVADCKVYDNDAIAAKNAFDLGRSLSAGYWEGSPLQLRQIPNIGPATAQKLIQDNIKTVAQLCAMEDDQIERIMSKNPPYGRKLLDRLASFPQLSLQANVVRNICAKDRLPQSNVKCRIGFRNSKTPLWNGQDVFVMFLAETSNGKLAHYWRGNVRKLDNGHELRFTAELMTPNDEVICHVVCEEILGTAQKLHLEPKVSTSAFPTPIQNSFTSDGNKSPMVSDPQWNLPDHFEDDGVEDTDMIQILQDLEASPAQDRTIQPNATGPDDFADIDDFCDAALDPSARSPQKMANGKWMCNHDCRDGGSTRSGKTCKHQCCHFGLEKPRKPNRSKRWEQTVAQSQSHSSEKTHTTVPKNISYSSSTEQAGTTMDTLKISSEVHRDHKPQLGLEIDSGVGVDDIIDLSEDLSPIDSTDIALLEQCGGQYLHTHSQGLEAAPFSGSGIYISADIDDRAYSSTLSCPGDVGKRISDTLEQPSGTDAYFPEYVDNSLAYWTSITDSSQPQAEGKDADEDEGCRPTSSHETSTLPNQFGHNNEPHWNRFESGDCVGAGEPLPRDSTKPTNSALKRNTVDVMMSSSSEIGSAKKKRRPCSEADEEEHVGGAPDVEQTEMVDEPLTPSSGLEEAGGSWLLDAAEADSQGRRRQEKSATPDWVGEMGIPSMLYHEFAGFTEFH